MRYIKDGRPISINNNEIIKKWCHIANLGKEIKLCYQYFVYFFRLYLKLLINFTALFVRRKTSFPVFFIF